MLLAGGGTAGHVSPLLALADALRRRDPPGRRHRARHRARPRGPAGARARLPASRWCRRCRCPRRPSVDLLRAARHLRARPCAPPSDAIEQTRAEVVVGLRRLRLHPGLPRRPAARHVRSSCTSRTPDRVSPTASVPASPPAWRHLPRHQAAARAPSPGCRCAAQIATLDRAARRAEARARVRARPDAPRCSSPAARRAPSASTTPSPPRVRSLSAAGIQVLHVAGTGRGFVADRGPATPPYVVARVLRPHGPRLRRRRPRAVPRRRQRPCASSPPSGCRRSTCRCRSATASSGSTRRPWSRPAAVSSSTTPTLTPQWVDDVVRPLALDQDRLATMAAAAASAGGARTATSCSPTSSSRAAEVAGHDDHPRRATTSPHPWCRSRCSGACTSSASAAPACRPSHGSCWRAASPVSGSATPQAPPSWSRCAARGPCRPGPRRRRTLPTPTPSSCPPPSATTTSSWPRPGRANLRVLHRSQALASLMGGQRRVAVAGTHGKTTTTSMLTVGLSHCGADPSFAIGGEIASSARTRPRWRRRLRRRGRRERRLVPRLPPRRRDGHQRRSPTTSTTTAPARTSRPPTRASPPRSPTGVCSSPARRRRVAPARRDGAAPLAARCSPTATARGADLRVGEVRSEALGTRSVFVHEGVERVLELAVPGDHNVMDAAAAYLAAVAGLGAEPDARPRRPRRLRRCPASLRGAWRGRRRHRRRRLRAQPGQGRGRRRHAHPTSCGGPGAGPCAWSSSHTCTPAPATSRRSSLAPWRRPTRSSSSTSTAPASNRWTGVGPHLIADPLRELPGQRSVLVAPARSDAVTALVDAARPGDLVLTVGAGDVTALAPLVVEALRARSGGERR